MRDQGRAGTLGGRPRFRGTESDVPPVGAGFLPLGRPRPRFGASAADGQRDERVGARGEERRCSPPSVSGKAASLSSFASSSAGSGREGAIGIGKMEGVPVTSVFTSMYIHPNNTHGPRVPVREYRTGPVGWAKKRPLVVSQEEVGNGNPGHALPC